jgi:hypothetical protein
MPWKTIALISTRAPSLPTVQKLSLLSLASLIALPCGQGLAGAHLTEPTGSLELQRDDRACVNVRRVEEV